VFDIKEPSMAMANNKMRGPWFGNADLTVIKEPFN